MVLVTDGDGNRYQLLKRSSSASLVQNLDTAEVRYIPNTQIDQVAEAKDADCDSRPAELPSDDAALILSTIGRNGQVTSRALLESTTLCESDLFLILRELEVGELICRDELLTMTAWAPTTKGEEVISQLNYSTESGDASAETD